MNNLTRLNDETLLDLSRIVIASLPSDTCENVLADKDKQEMTSKYKFRTIVEFSKTIETLFDYWKKALFHTKKPQTVKTDFEDIGIDSELAEKIANLWLEEASKIVPKAKALSRSGVSDVKDIRWTLNLERLTCSDGSKREPKINLQFNTSSEGKKCVTLNYDELKQLYTELQEVQQKIDSVFK